MNVQSKPANGRQTLIVLAALFAAPVILSTLLYTQGWRPTGSINYGSLVQPPVRLADITLKGANGQSMNVAKLQHWALIVMPGAQCDDRCRRDLRSIRQAHLAQGRKRDQIMRIMIVNDNENAASLESVQQSDPDITIATGSKRDIDVMARTFARTNAGPGPAAGVYVVDPAGNFMMTYPSGVDPSHIRKDLKRLLTVSQIR